MAAKKWGKLTENGDTLPLVVEHNIYSIAKVHEYHPSLHCPVSSIDFLKLFIYLFDKLGLSSGLSVPLVTLYGYGPNYACMSLDNSKYSAGDESILRALFPGTLLLCVGWAVS